jgi:hypothetical protein
MRGRPDCPSSSKAGSVNDGYLDLMRRLVRIGDTVENVFLDMPRVLSPLMPDAARLQ